MGTGAAATPREVWREDGGSDGADVTRCATRRLSCAIILCLPLGATPGRAHSAADGDARLVLREVAAITLEADFALAGMGPAEGGGTPDLVPRAWQSH
jgi:hypothetical protein